MQDTVLFDIDGTLSNCTHRRNYLLSEPKNWAEFYGHLTEDEVNPWCLRLIKMCRADGLRACLVSGRPDDYRERTLSWLAFNEVPYDELHMRRAGDSRKDFIVKEEILHARFDPAKILFVVDDRKSVAEMWRRNGLTVLHCDEGNY
jgi:hypothetical protein